MDHTRGGRREVEDPIKRVPVQTSEELLGQVANALADRIKKQADFLTPDDFKDFRELCKLLPQLQEMLENRRRQQWLWKRIGAFLLGGPAILALWQAAAKLIEWIRSSQ